MGHSMASWKLLEDMMIELKKKGVAIPPHVINDLRSAKSMILLGCNEDSRGEVYQKAEEFSANVEAFLVTEAQKVLGSEQVDLWLRRLEEANAETCEVQSKEADKFITGVPRDQKWIRVEPTGDLTLELVEQAAKENNLQVKHQENGRIVVYGQPQDIKVFLKKITPQKKM
ncbi:MAG: DUF2096 domain-containing protein [Candidatus Bathyarchaeota archaeon]|nr:DUF2096 domain-containing protein [Candidatus Bathyarchaeota archaeon]